MSVANIVRAVVKPGSDYTVTSPIMKENKGQVLLIEGLDLPEVYEIDFSNDRHHGSSITMIGNADGVLIPAQFIKTGRDVFAFYYYVGDGFGKTEHIFRLPNDYRPDRTDEAPEPEQQSKIDQAIAAVNEAVDTAQGYANNAADSAEEAARKAGEIEELTAAAQTLAPGSEATAIYQNGILTIGVPRGDKGDKGDTGERGPQGEQGVQGIQGIQGIQGLKGDKGDTGAQGIQGPKGERGEQGIQGIKGDKGDTGEKGDKGDKGDTGEQGIQGERGLTGATGATGATPNLTIGTVETLEPSESATATITGTPENPVLNLGIPQGEQGEVTLEDYYKAFPTDTASGAVASFTDGADGLPLKSLVVNIDPVQDLHGQESPYPAGGGKNKLNLDADVVVLKGAIPSAVSIASGNGSATITEGYYNRTANVFGWAFNVESNQAYTCSFVYNSTARGNAKLYTADGTLLTSFEAANGNVSKTFDTGENSVLYFYLSISSWDQTMTISNVQIEKGSTATDWTPYENLCPISGWTGANLYMTGANLAIKNATYCGKFKIGADGRIQSSVYPTWCLPVPRGTIACSKVVIGVTGKINYLALTDEIPQAGTSYYDINGDAGGNAVSFTNYSTRTVNNSANHKYLVLMAGTGEDDFETAVKRNVLMVSFGEDKPYVDPIDGTTLPISWQTEAGTVYGGKLDVLSGVLTVEKVTAIYDGTETYSNSYFPTVVCTKALPTGKGGGNTFLCSHLPTGTYYADFSSSTKRAIQFGHCDTVWNVASANELKAKIAEQYANGTPVTFVYELATPIEIQLDAHAVNSLYGQNNIFADTGECSVEYRADTKLYIERLTAPDSADMIADANFVSGQYFMVGNSLYKATANIANGGQIIVGTNCTRVSLAQALNEINA